MVYVWNTVFIYHAYFVDKLVFDNGSDPSKSHVYQQRAPIHTPKTVSTSNIEFAVSNIIQVGVAELLHPA